MIYTLHVQIKNGKHGSFDFLARLYYPDSPKIETCESQKKFALTRNKRRGTSALTFALGLTILEMVLKMELSINLSDCCGVRSPH